MTRDNLIPDVHLSRVIQVLYEEAQAKGWRHLPPRDRTALYNSWIEDERVGGVLTQYMSPEAARAWIKDGPMKEYGRALRGTGRYARFGGSGASTVEDILLASLGRDWTVVDGTVGIKPFHAHAENRTGQLAFLTWGEARNFKNLVWAALRACVDLDIPGHVIVTEPQGVIIPRETAEMHSKITKRCHLGIHYVREQLGTVK